MARAGKGGPSLALESTLRSVPTLGALRACGARPLGAAAAGAGRVITRALTTADLAIGRGTEVTLGDDGGGRFGVVALREPEVGLGLGPVGAVRDGDLIVFNGAERAGVLGAPHKVVHAAARREFDHAVGVGADGGTHPGREITDQSNIGGSRNSVAIIRGAAWGALGEEDGQAHGGIGGGGKESNHTPRVYRVLPALDVLARISRNGGTHGIKAGRVLVNSRAEVDVVLLRVSMEKEKKKKKKRGREIRILKRGAGGQGGEHY